MAALALTVTLAAGLSYVGLSTADSLPMNNHLLETTTIELMISTISPLLSVRYLFVVSTSWLLG